MDSKENSGAPGPVLWPGRVKAELVRRNRAGSSWRKIAQDLGGKWSHATLNRIARNGQAPPRSLAQELGIPAPPAWYIVQFRLRSPAVAHGLREAIRAHGDYATVAEGLASGRLVIKEVE